MARIPFDWNARPCTGVLRCSAGTLFPMLFSSFCLQPLYGSWQFPDSPGQGDGRGIEIGDVARRAPFGRCRPCCRRSLRGLEV